MLKSSTDYIAEAVSRFPEARVDLTETKALTECIDILAQAYSAKWKPEAIRGFFEQATQRACSTYVTATAAQLAMNQFIDDFSEHLPKYAPVKKLKDPETAEVQETSEVQESDSSPRPRGRPRRSE
jgi:hypothetical protein